VVTEPQTEKGRDHHWWCPTPSADGRRTIRAGVYRWFVCHGWSPGRRSRVFEATKGSGS